MDLIKEIKNFISKINEHHIKEYAIECAYYVILSFIPFIILLFSLVQYTSIGQDAIYLLAERIFPSNIADFAQNVIKEASFKSFGTLSLSLIFTLWSSARGFFALCKGLHYIYKTPAEYNYWYSKLKSCICTVLFILIIIGILLLITFGSTITNYISSSTSPINIILIFLLKWRFIWQIFILFILFLLMYRFIPNHKVNFKSQIPGSLFAALGFYLLSYFFSVYLSIFHNFSVIYGSLSSIVLLMIWVYWCMLALLIGAEINIFLKK